jgi:hypothetical protein
MVYNDAMFTKEDFDSLRKLGDSMKKDKKMATGKFGLGFNSVSLLGLTPYLTDRSMGGQTHRPFSQGDFSLRSVHTSD